MLGFQPTPCVQKLVHKTVHSIKYEKRNEATKLPYPLQVATFITSLFFFCV